MHDGRLAREGQTMVIVSHDLHALEKFANTVHILERGKVIFSASAADAFGEDGPATRLMH